MSGKHTPGPWGVDDEDYGPQVIAQVRYADWVVETGRVKADALCWSDIATFSGDTALADATLASAAPALLDALTRLLEELDGGNLCVSDACRVRADEHEDGEALAMARRAISSATGGE